MIPQTTSRYKIREEIRPEILESLMQNYKNSTQAVLELIDNAVDDRIEEKLLAIKISLGKNFIQIINEGGAGMGLPEIEGFLKWGLSEKRGKLGRYGQGGKAAMGYLGKSWILESSKLNEEKTYIIAEDNWTNHSNLKAYTPTVLVGKTPTHIGRVSFEIRNLTRGKKLKAEKLESELSDYYRMLLEEGKIEIVINGRKIKPLQFPLEKKESFRETLRNLGTVSGWVGILKPDSNTRGGTRCCVLGRKITEGEYFKQKDFRFKASLNRLVGEIDADFIELNLNKTDFDKDSYGWQKLEKLMFHKLQPYIDELLRQRDEDLIDREERERCREAGKNWNQFYRDYLKGNLPGIGNIDDEDFDFGQKPKVVEWQTLIKDKLDLTDRKNKPATPPPDISMGQRKRLKRLLAIEVEPAIINDPRVRSEIREEGGKKKLLVNKKFPAYRKRDGDYLYIYETCCLEFAKPDPDEDMNINSYLRVFNEIYSAFCTYADKHKIKL